MRYVRFVYKGYWDPNRRQFNHLAFRLSDGGVSIIDRECASQASTTICEHLRRWYRPCHGEQSYIYWEFDSSVIPATARIRPTLSDSGDVCHREVCDIHRNDAKKIAYNIALGNVMVCENGAARSAVESDFTAVQTITPDIQISPEGTP